MRVDLRHGDCVDLMRAMPECSVDSIVTDPPYGLEFMGKDWDAPWKGSGTVESVHEGQDKSHPFRDGSSRVRYGTKDMPAFQAWFETVAAEALRVLKPGGHLLAFGGTRTYHRMACAIEDAGFEIRDSIHWVYGSGFPKSLNVGKAIDKTNGEGDRAWKFTGWMRTTGLTARQLDEVTGTNMGGHYLTAKSQPAIPTAELWALIRPLCGEVPEWVDELVARVEAEREVVGTSKGVTRPGFAGDTYGPNGGIAVEVPVTAPATDEARRWEGWGTALKPAHEPVVVARKPLSGTVASNVLAWGTGGLNIDGCRVGTDDNLGGGTFGGVFGNGKPAPDAGSPLGRWPANIVLDGAAAAALDQQSGNIPTQKTRTNPHRVGTAEGLFGGFSANGTRQIVGAGEKGGASRFFTQADFGPEDWPFVYQAKPSRRERNAGLDGLPEQRRSTDYGAMKTRVCNVCGSRSKRNGRWPDCDDDDWRWDEQQDDGHKGGNAINHHPTVKPVALMRHLVRLVTPPGGVVLDPFAGSGTTLVAAVLEGMNAVGCEMTDEYLPIIEGRVAWAEEQARTAAEAEANPEQPTLL